MKSEILDSISYFTTNCVSLAIYFNYLGISVLRYKTEITIPLYIAAMKTQSVTHDRACVIPDSQHLINAY